MTNPIDPSSELPDRLNLLLLAVQRWLAALALADAGSAEAGRFAAAGDWLADMQLLAEQGDWDSMWEQTSWFVLAHCPQLLWELPAGGGRMPARRHSGFESYSWSPTDGAEKTQVRAAQTERETRGLMLSLRQLFHGRPEAPPIAARPVVHAPTAVRRHTSFCIEITSEPGHAGAQAETLDLPRFRERWLDLEVEIEPLTPGGLALRSPPLGILRVFADGRAASLRFTLFAEQDGTHEVAVAFRHGGIERTRLRRLITVQQEAPPAGAKPAMGEPARGEPQLMGGCAFRGLLLQVHERPAGGALRSFRVSLRCSQWRGPALEGELSLPGDARELLAGLCQDIPRVSALAEPEACELRLQGIGADLARRVLPRAVAEALSTCSWPEGTALHIESDDAWVPWEALWLPDSTEDGGWFLGERFMVTRWPRVGSACEQINRGSAVLISPAGAGLNVEAEQRALGELTGEAPLELGRLLEVQKCLRGSPPCQILHFACHGGGQPGSSFADALLLTGGSLHPTDVLLSAPAFAGPLDGRLVFLNACEAGLARAGFFSHDGWAAKLLHAGVGALVAPSWMVTDRGASRFAAAFYGYAAAGHCLGEAARRARRHLRFGVGSDRLSYAVYAVPSCRFAPPQPAAEPRESDSLHWL